jgi:ppGpp synthetase/RelA/SpoT-type nucleotidyltranferase
MHSYNELLKAYEELLKQYTLTASKLLAYETDFINTLSKENGIRHSEQEIKLYRSIIDKCDKFGINSGIYQDAMKQSKRYIDIWSKKEEAE